MKQAERITALEVRVEGLERSHTDIAQTQKDIAQKQNQILQELARYRGVVGMLMLSISALWSVALLFKGWLFAQFKKGGVSPGLAFARGREKRGTTRVPRNGRCRQGNTPTARQYAERREAESVAQTTSAIAARPQDGTGT